MQRGEGKSFGPEANERIRTALRAVMERHENNQTRVGRALGISQPAVSALLSGRNNCSAAVAQRIARELGTSLDALLGVAAAPRAGAWSDDPAWPRLLAEARRLFPRLSPDAWDWTAGLAGSRLPDDAWALGSIALAWELAQARR